MLTEILVFLAKHINIIMYISGILLSLWTVILLVITFIKNRDSEHLVQMPFNFIIKHPLFIGLICLYGYFSFENHMWTAIQHDISNLYKITQVSEEKIKKIEDCISGPNGLNERVTKIENLKSEQQQSTDPENIDKIQRKIDTEHALIEKQSAQIKELTDKTMNREILHMAHVSVALLQGNINEHPILKEKMDHIIQKNPTVVNNSIVMWIVLQYLWNNKDTISKSEKSIDVQDPNTHSSWFSFLWGSHLVTETQHNEEIEKIISDEKEKDCPKFAQTILNAWNVLTKMDFTGINIDKIALMHFYIQNINNIVT